MRNDRHLAESVIQRLIIARLNLLPGVKVWRQSTGVARHGGRVVRYGIPGQADITGLVDGRRIELEVKTATGRVRPEQKAYGVMIRQYGGVYAVVRSIDDALRAVQEARQR